MPARVNLTILQGSTYRKVFRYGGRPLVYKPITGATKAAPCVLTVASHGVPDGWPIVVQSVRGMEDLNSEAPRVATVRDSNTIELNDTNALDFDSYAGGGTIVYSTPVDLTGYTARAQIRESIESTDVILSLTTENDGIEIDVEASSVTLVLTPTQTAALDFDAAVYDLEMVSADGQVTRIVFGSVELSLETTR